MQHILSFLYDIFNLNNFLISIIAEASVCVFDWKTNLELCCLVMSFTEAALKKMSKDEVIALTLEYQAIQFDPREYFRLEIWF